MSAHSAEKKARNKRVPFSAKIGWIVAWLIMSTLVVMASKNFVAALLFGTKTDGAQLQEFYEKGFADGLSSNETLSVGPQTKNPLLKKSFIKGFREGLEAREK